MHSKLSLTHDLRIQSQKDKNWNQKKHKQWNIEAGFEWLWRSFQYLRIIYEFMAYSIMTCTIYIMTHTVYS